MGFNDTSTLVDHFVSSPRERKKRNRRDSRDEIEGRRRQRNRNESEETEEIKHSTSTLTCYKGSRPCPTVSQYQANTPVTQDTRHLPHTQPPQTAKEPRLLETDSKVSDQTARQHRLSLVITGYIFHVQNSSGHSYHTGNLTE